MVGTKTPADLPSQGGISRARHGDNRAAGRLQNLIGGPATGPAYRGSGNKRAKWWVDAGNTEAPLMSLGTILLILLVLALLGGFSGIGGGPFYGTGYYGGGGLGLVLVIVLILVLMGRL